MAPSPGTTIEHGEVPTNHDKIYDTMFVSQGAPAPVNRAERRLYRFRGRSDQARKLQSRTILVQTLEEYLD